MGEYQGDDGLFKVVSCVPVKVRSAMGDARFEEIRSEVRQQSTSLQSKTSAVYVSNFFSWSAWQQFYWESFEYEVV